MTGAGGSLDPRGPIAEEIHRLWWILLVLGAVVIAVMAVLIVGLIRRHPSDTPPEEDSLTPTKWIVAGGVIMPAGHSRRGARVSIDSTWVVLAPACGRTV